MGSRAIGSSRNIARHAFILCQPCSAVRVMKYQHLLVEVVILPVVFASSLGIGVHPLRELSAVRLMRGLIRLLIEGLIMLVG